MHPHMSRARRATAFMAAALALAFVPAAAAADRLPTAGALDASTAMTAVVLDGEAGDSISEGHTWTFVSTCKILVVDRRHQAGCD